MNTNVYKYCAVPLCDNTSKTTPDKLFVYVPHTKTTRYKWLKLAWRNPKLTKLSTTLYFCEDHFDLPNDMINFMEYHLMGRVSQIRMKPGCLPTKFQCQADRTKQQTDVTKQPHILRKQTIKEFIKETGTTTKQVELEDTSSQSSDDSEESTCEIETDQKVSTLDFEYNMLLAEDNDNMYCEDTKIFTPQWKLEVSDIGTVCRICLAVNVKMYNIGDYKLKQYYQSVTGIQSCLEDSLPKMLCWECAARLKNAHIFREKALRSYKLLLCQVKAGSLSMSNVRSINRVENCLQSSLAAKCTSASDGDDVTADVTSQVLADLKQENESNEESQETAASDDGGDQDPLDTANPRRSGVRRRCDDAAPARTKRARKSSSRAAAVLDGAVFDVLEVPLERALAEAARRAGRPEYCAAPHRCDLCYKVFATPAARDEHALRHSDVMGEFECVVCRCRWRTSTALRKHFTESHTRDHICKMCPFTTRNRGVAKRHERFHKGVKFQCSRCPKEFVSHTAYLSHLRLNHVCRFPCALCGFAFHTRRGVDSHRLKKHKRDKNIELAGPYCAECDVRFATDEAHDRHLQLTAAHRREDTNGRRIRNDYYLAEKRQCRKTTKTKSESSKPKTTESERHLVCCEQCGAECEGYRAYAQHFRRRHPGSNRTQYSGADPAMCEHCGRIFQNPCLLRAHAALHAGGVASSGPRRAGGRSAGTLRRAHACPLCPKRFTEKSNRARHIVTIHHGTERRFRCSVCDKRFWERSALQSHYDHVHLKKPWPKRTRPPRARPAPATGQSELDSDGKDVSAEV